MFRIAGNSTNELYQAMTDDQSPAARTWRLNFLLSTATLSAAVPDLAGLGLSGKEFFVLDGIEDTPFPAELAASLSMTRPNLTMHLKALQGRGLIDRFVDERDLRRHRLALTGQGHRVLADARRIVTAKYEEKLQKLSLSERVDFTRLLEKLVTE